MPEFIRVKQKDTKHELTIVASAFNEDAYTKLKKPATKADGTPLPLKPYVAPRSLSSKKSTGQKAADEKESR